MTEKQGIIAALRSGELESRKMRNGLMDKSLVLITILALTIGLRVAEVAGVTASNGTLLSTIVELDAVKEKNTSLILSFVLTANTMVEMSLFM